MQSANSFATQTSRFLGNHPSHLGIGSRSSFIPGSPKCTFIRNVARHLAACSSSAKTRRKSTVMMPVGVPRVPYRTPRENTWQWVDIWNCLVHINFAFMFFMAVDDETGNQIVATMLYLDSVDKNDINFYINCTGGEVVPILAIHDCMKHIQSECGSVGFGGCMGMSGFLLTVAAKGKRRLLPNTRLMLHHPSGAARGQASDIHNEARELLYLRDYITAILADATGKPFETVFQDFSRNRYFSADDALEYGLVDKILPPPKTNILDM